MPVQKKGGLGKGLGALFSEQQIPAQPAAGREIPTQPSPAADAEDGSKIQMIDINEITPNRDQPRKEFDADKLEELAASIREHGLLQPILVRKIDHGYEIVAGERRWRASRLAELKTVPCIVGEYTEQENMLVALIENLQREDLNPLEEAEAYSRLAEEFGMTHEGIAESLGQIGVKRSRSAITNTLRLRELPEEVKTLIAQGKLSAGHGRALLRLSSDKDRIAAAEEILEKGLNVRQAEDLVQDFRPKGKTTPPARTLPAVSYGEVESGLKETLGAKVQIKEKDGKGSIRLSFYSREELERLIELLQSLDHK